MGEKGDEIVIVETHAEEETEALGERRAKCLRAGAVVALYGDLGAGKTAFVRGMARGLDVHEPVSSPTFTIVNEYPGDPALFHFDMYRLKNAEELYGIGWEDYLDRNGVVVTEWTENVEEAIPADAVRVTIDRTGDSDRRIRIEGML